MGSNIKRTRKREIGDPGPWFCQLCSSGAITTKSGMRKHYKNHYKNWDAQTNLIYDMSESERAQQEFTKGLKSVVQMFPSAATTGASPVLLNPVRHQYVGHTDEISSARGIPPRTYASSSESGIQSERAGLPENDRTTGQDRRIVLLDEDGPDLTETHRAHSDKTETGINGTYARRSAYLKSNIRLDSAFRFVVGRFLPHLPIRVTKWNPDQDPVTEDVVCLDDEPKVKIKNEFVSYEQVEKRPQLETLKQLLLFGVDATVDAAKKRVWPTMTISQENQLKCMFETMLATVPLVRQLDRTMTL